MSKTKIQNFKIIPLTLVISGVFFAQDNSITGHETIGMRAIWVPQGIFGVAFAKFEIMFIGIFYLLFFKVNFLILLLPTMFVISYFGSGDNFENGLYENLKKK